MNQRPAMAVVLAVAVCTVLSSCSPEAFPELASPSPSSADTAVPGGTPQIAPSGTPRAIASGLEAPWSVVFHDGTPLVSERDSARILELGPDGTARPIGTVEGVAGAGEGGLLGMAMDGQGRLYVYSTASDGNRIQRFDVTGSPGNLSLGQPFTILDGVPSAVYHNGGRIAFGPDGMLYAAMGDAGQGSLAQDLNSPAGKILRMTPDGGVPADNPFRGSLVYSYGHRNPQGLTWAEDGTMFSTEFGQNTWDELNIISPGANYGWPTAEGITETSGITNPVQQWEPSAASPSGITQIDGTLFIANLRGRVLRAVPVADPTTSTDYYSGEYGRIRDVIPAPDGDLWFLTNNTDGRGNPGEGDDRLLAVELTAPAF